MNAERSKKNSSVMNCGVVAVSSASTVSVPEIPSDRHIKSVFDPLECPINYTPMAAPDTVSTFDVLAVAPSRRVVLSTFVSTGEPVAAPGIVGVL